MRDILLFWAGKGVDGFRCDVAKYWSYLEQGRFNYLCDKVCFTQAEGFQGDDGRTMIFDYWGFSNTRPGPVGANSMGKTDR